MGDPSLPRRYCELRAWTRSHEYTLGVYERGTFKAPSWLLRRVSAPIRKSLVGWEFLGGEPRA